MLNHLVIIVHKILQSVNGNSYDSDAAIWHLLLEKFQKACQIDSK